MFHKFAVTGAMFTFLFFGIAQEGPLYANEGMMPQLPREVTAEDDSLAWTVPASWKQMPATGMRLGSFVSADQPEDIDVSIILLGPAAGALEPNLERWAGQISVSADAAAIKKVIENAEAVKTGLGQDVNVFYFSVLQSGQEASTKSVVVSVIQLEKATVFVKMTGTLGTTAKNSGSFKELVGSIRRK